MKALLLAAVTTVVLACGSDASSAATLKGTLEYARSGGFAGVVEAAAIRPDGRATVTANRKAQRRVRLEGWERDRIARYVREADIAHVKVNSKSECCDQFDYRIRYAGRTLEWSSEHFPKRLAKLVDELDRLIEKYG